MVGFCDLHNVNPCFGMAIPRNSVTLLAYLVLDKKDLDDHRTIEMSARPSITVSKITSIASTEITIYIRKSSMHEIF